MSRAPTTAVILADLARVKAVFQMREIEAVIRGGGLIELVEAQAIEARSDETLQAAQPERRERDPKDAPERSSPTGCTQSTGDVG